jgi:hypothetical protein
MKKLLFLLIVASVLLTLSSCKRSEIDTPGWDGPAGFYVILKGSATPAMQLIDGKEHVTEIYVRVTDSSNKPLANQTVHFQQLASAYQDDKVNWGKFSNGLCTIDRVTNANGEIWVNFYWPLKYHQYMMYIHAQMVVNGSAYPDGNIPQDYIALTMYHP